MKNNFLIRKNCRWFKGDVPCFPWHTCESCTRFEPIEQRVLIIKLGAIGDVLRTTPILPELKKKYPNCHITWVAEAPSIPLLKNRFIDRVVEHGVEALIRVLVEKFDIVYSLDKHPAAAGLAVLAKAEKKIGFILDNANGNIFYTGQSAEYAYQLGLDDNLKFKKNEKSYQEVIFEMLGLRWARQKYILELSEEIKNFGKKLIEELTSTRNGPVIGFVTGSGNIWPLKRWTIKGFAELAEQLIDKKDAHVILVGAEQDKQRNIEIQNACKKKIFLAPHNLSISEFAGVLANCDVIVTGDTAGLHIGLAVETPTVAIFGPTSWREVEMYNVGTIVFPKLDCAPCYRLSCDISPNCMETISADEVFNAIEKLLIEEGQKTL